jgi:hypothetical protein
MNAPELWGVFFQYLLDKSKRGIINEILELEEGIAMASEVLITITKEEREQAWLMSREKYELDTQSDLAYAKQEGMREGELRGRQEDIQYVLGLIGQWRSLEEIELRLRQDIGGDGE